MFFFYLLISGYNSLTRPQRMLRNLLTRKELLHVLRLKVQEQLYKEWKKPCENMNRCPGPLGNRYLAMASIIN